MPTTFRTFGDRAIVTGHLLDRLPSGRGIGQRGEHARARHDG